MGLKHFHAGQPTAKTLCRLSSSPGQGQEVLVGAHDVRRIEFNCKLDKFGIEWVAAVFEVRGGRSYVLADEQKALDQEGDMLGRYRGEPLHDTGVGKHQSVFIQDGLTQQWNDRPIFGGSAQPCGR